MTTQERFCGRCGNSISEYDIDVYTGEFVVALDIYTIPNDVALDLDDQPPSRPRHLKVADRQP